MAFPSIEDNVSTNAGTATTTPPINIPATVSPGAFLIACYRAAGGGAIGWPTDWVELVDGSPDGSDDQVAIAYKIAVGDEDGTNPLLSTPLQKGAGICYSIIDADTSVPPEISAAAIGTTVNPDSPSLTPSWGAADTLWLTIASYEGEQNINPTEPTNYALSPVAGSSGTAGSITTNCRVAAVGRQLNAASEDPGAWTISTADDWTCYTVAIKPIISVPGPVWKRRPAHRYMTVR